MNRNVLVGSKIGYPFSVRLIEACKTMGAQPNAAINRWNHNLPSSFFTTDIRSVMSIIKGVFTPDHQVQIRISRKDVCLPITFDEDIRRSKFYFQKGPLLIRLGYIPERSCTRSLLLGVHDKIAQMLWIVDLFLFTCRFGGT
jgi:hypothetical protein